MNKNNRYFNVIQSFAEKINITTLVINFLFSFLLLVIYLFSQPKQPTFAMINLHDINQSFIYFLADQNFTNEEKSKWLQIFSNALNQELKHLSQDYVLLSAQTVVTPLPDYTQIVKKSITQTILLSMDKKGNE